MSKLSFRARALDPSKPMPIYLAEELPDLPEYSAINRAVPQMPSGMEKEEESEHHLQRAICAGLIIPTPEVFETEEQFYDRNYPDNYKMPKQYIHMQPLAMEQDIPDYDMDSADELWVNSQSHRLEITPFKFEQMMDRLEKSSGQTVVTLNEAKALLKQDDEVSIAVYDYWLNKRLKTQHPLILSVKTENRPGTAQNNPYLAFRRRTEKMQTRKNRKNDESSYEKMLKLRRDLSRAVTLLEMIKRREKAKREQMHLGIEIFEKRYQASDFSGQLISEFTTNVSKNTRPAFTPIYQNQYSHSPTPATPVVTNQWSNNGMHHQYSVSQYLNSTQTNNKRERVDAVEMHTSGGGSRKEKRQYKKRKHKQREKAVPYPVTGQPPLDIAASSEDEDITGSIPGTEEDDGLFMFKRNKISHYHRPISNYGNWPWVSKTENGSAESKYRFTLTSIRQPKPRCIGFSRRRVGRGGRIILDRTTSDLDDLWTSLDYTIFDSAKEELTSKSLNNNSVSCVNSKLINDSSSIVVASTSGTSIHESNNTVNNKNNNLSCVSDNSVVLKQQQQRNNEQLLIRTNNNLNKNNNVISDDGATSAGVIKQEINDDDFDKILSRYTRVNLNNSLLAAAAAVNSNCSGSNFGTTTITNTTTPTDLISTVQQKNNAGQTIPSTSAPSSPAVVTINSVTIIKTEPKDDQLQQDGSCGRNGHDTDGSLAVTTSMDLDEDYDKYFDNLYEDIRKNWLHFRPRTPDEKTISVDSLDDGQSDLLKLSETTPITVELQTLHSHSIPPLNYSRSTSPSPYIFVDDQDTLFASNQFTLAEILDDSLAPPPVHPPSSPFDKSTASAASISLGELNSSGDSLNDLNLSLDEGIEDEKMLENILQECKIDSLQSFQTTTNFWNGLLEDTGSLLSGLDVYDEKKTDIHQIGYNSEFLNNERRNGQKLRSKINSRIGHSSFNVLNTMKSEYFKKDPTAVTTASGCGTAGVDETHIKLEPNINAVKMTPIDTAATTTTTTLAAIIKQEPSLDDMALSTLVQSQPKAITQSFEFQNVATGEKTTIPDGMIVLTSPIKKHVNGPAVDRNAIQNVLKQATNIRRIAVPSNKLDDIELHQKDSSGILDQYVKVSPHDFNFQTNNITTINTNHNYSLSPNTMPAQQLQQQQIILTQQQPQGKPQPKQILINSSPTTMSISSGGGGIGGQQFLGNTRHITISTPIQELITTPNTGGNVYTKNQLNSLAAASNIKINSIPSSTNSQHEMKNLLTSTIHPSLIVEKQSNVDVKTIIGTPMHQQQQQQHLQQQQQQKLKVEKTVNMLFDSDKNRILYTNLKNNRGTQFLHINQKVVNLLPIQSSNNKNNTVGIPTTTTVQNVLVGSPASNLNVNKNALSTTVQRIATNSQTGNAIISGGGVSGTATTGGIVVRQTSSSHHQQQQQQQQQQHQQQQQNSNDTLTKIMQNDNSINLNTPNR